MKLEWHKLSALVIYYTESRVPAKPADLLSIKTKICRFWIQAGTCRAHKTLLDELQATPAIQLQLIYVPCVLHSIQICICSSSHGIFARPVIRLWLEFQKGLSKDFLTLKHKSQVYTAILSPPACPGHNQKRMKDCLSVCWLCVSLEPILHVFFIVYMQRC